MTRTVSIDAPAKINLGLEILGKRPDGYHDVRTVMAMLELADRLTIGESVAVDDTRSSDVPLEDNLIHRALFRYREAVPGSPGLGWRIDKRIPMAAGLGGASADAAAALLAANHLAGGRLSHSELAAIAGSLGSDIPFFLGEPFALSKGRGTELDPLPAIRFPLLLIVPEIAIPRKTATLYSLIQPGDYSDGSRANWVATSIARGAMPAGDNLGNSFSRALRELDPRVDQLCSAIARLSPTFGLSGAGPAFFAIDSPTKLAEISRTLKAEFGDWLELVITSTRTLPLTVEESANPAKSERRSG